MASPEIPMKWMLSVSEVDARDHKRMKSNTSPAREPADQDTMEFDEPAAQNNISQSDQVTRPAYLDQTAPDESVYIPAHVYKVLTLDGTVVETVQDPNPGAGDAVVVPGTLEAAAQSVIVYTEPPRPRKGEGTYNSSLLLPPWIPREIRDQIWGYLAKFPRAITLAELGYVLHKHYSNHLRVCAFAAGDDLAAQKFFIENGGEKYHPRRLREGDRTKSITPYDNFAIADGFCIDHDTNERTIIDVPDTVLRFRQICKQVNEELTPIFFQQNRFAFLDATDMLLKLEGLNNIAKKAQENSSAVGFDSGCREQIRTIHEVFLQFSPLKATLYRRIAAYLPLLWVLNITLRHDAGFMRFDSRDKRPGKNPLALAKGIPALAQAFNKHNGPCKEIRVVKINGTDLIRVLTINEDEWYTRKVDINHDKAIGPVLKRNIFEVDEGWLSSVEQIDQWAKEKEKKRQEKLRKEESRRKKEEDAKLRAKTDQEKLERRAKQNEEKTKLKAKKEQQKPQRLIKQRVVKPSATDKAETLAKESLTAAERERDKKRRYTDVQLAQVRLHEQALGRSNEGYQGIAYFWEKDFVGPINLPRTYDTYEDWRTANGNVAAIDPPPPNHAGTTLLSNLEKFRIDNGYQEVNEGRRYRTILPKPGQPAPHALSHGAQAQHNHGQNGNDYGLQTCGTKRFPSQSLQQTLDYNVPTEHIQAQNGQGMRFAAMGIPSQPFQGQNLNNQSMQLPGFQSQPNYDSEVQNLERNSYINNEIVDAHAAWYAQNPSKNGSMSGNPTNNVGMIKPLRGQILFGAAANTERAPAIQNPSLGLSASQNQKPAAASHDKLADGPPSKRQRVAGQFRQLAPAPPRQMLPASTTGGPLNSPPRPVPQHLLGGTGTPQKPVPAQGARGSSNALKNAQSRSAAQQGGVHIDLAGRHPHPVLRGHSDVPANAQRGPSGQVNQRSKQMTQKAPEQSTFRGATTNPCSAPAAQNSLERPLNHNQPPAVSILRGAQADSRPVPAAQSSLGGPFNPLPVPAARGNSLENAPNGYGGFSIHQTGGGPSQGFVNNNDNSSGFNRQD